MAKKTKEHLEEVKKNKKIKNKGKKIGKNLNKAEHTKNAKKLIKFVLDPRKKVKAGAKVVKETAKKVAPKVTKKVIEKGKKVTSSIIGNIKGKLSKTKESLAKRKKTKETYKRRKEALKTKKKDLKDKKLQKVKDKNKNIYSKQDQNLVQKYKGKPMSDRNKVLVGVGAGLAGAELIRKSLDLGLASHINPKVKKTKSSGYDGTIPNTVDKTNIPSHLTNIKNPKITYKKPEAGKDFPNYNNSTGGNYSHQASGTQKDDLIYEHASQTQMNKARSSMGQGSYNFTGKKPKKQGY